MRRKIIGVMGPGAKATEEDKEYAFELGALIAKEGWVLLSGGRNEGVMDAACRGAKSAGGLIVGIIPSNNNADTSEAVDIAIVTDMGSARNNINVLSSDVVIACGMGAGTASEIALALKAGKNVVLMQHSDEGNEFFAQIGGKKIFCAAHPGQAVDIAKRIML